MIEKLRRRFMRVALVALSLAMILVTAAIYAADNVAAWQEMRSTLTDLMDRQSRAPDVPDFDGRGRHRKNLMDESRFFIAALEEDDRPRITDGHLETNLSEDEMLDMVERVREEGREGGRIGDYLYGTFERGDGSTGLLFLNCETRLVQLRTLALFSVAACALGILAAAVAVSLYSRRMIRPMVENEKQQKRFITDASHELKTPLTVISANMEVLNLEVPDNTWVRSTQKQVSVLRRLVDQMVYLFRMEENDAVLDVRTVNMSRLAMEVAEPMMAMAEFQGKTMTADTGTDVTLPADPKAMERLVSILCDNAVKYTPEGGAICLRVERRGRNLLLVTENDTRLPMDEETCGHLFDRFYRGDPSRNKEGTGGYGIGLSIAKAIAERHGGTVGARWTAGKLEIHCLLPDEGGGRKRGSDNEDRPKKK